MANLPKRKILVKKSSDSTSTSSESTSEISYICGVCLAKYNEGHRVPKTLLCGHSFCKSCVRSLFAVNHASRVTCPLCRAKHRIHLNGIPTNYQLLQLLIKEDLLCKEKESRPPSPIPSPDDAILAEIDNNMSSDFNNVLQYYGHEADSIKKELNDVGVNVNKLIPPRRTTGTGWTAAASMTVVESAKSIIDEMSNLLHKLSADISDLRNAKKFVNEHLANGSITIDKNATNGLVFNTEVAGLNYDTLQESTVHSFLNYPLTRLNATFNDRDDDFGFYLGPDEAPWEQEDDDDEDEDRRSEEYEEPYRTDEEYDFDSNYSPSNELIYGASAISRAFSTDANSTRFSVASRATVALDGSAFLVINGFCYLCSCFVPPGARSINIHCTGSRHRAKLDQNEVSLDYNQEYTQEELQALFGTPPLEQLASQQRQPARGRARRRGTFLLRPLLDFGLSNASTQNGRTYDVYQPPHRNRGRGRGRGGARGRRLTPLNTLIGRLPGISRLVYAQLSEAAARLDAVFAGRMVPSPRGMLPRQPAKAATLEDRMDSASDVTFPIFGTVSPPGSDISEGDIPDWLAKASDGFNSEGVVKKLQQTKYDRVVKCVVHDGIQNLLYNRYTPLILPSFQDEDIMELTLISARLKTMGLNASAAAISGECGEVLNTKKVSKYYSNYTPGVRLTMPNMERKVCEDFTREKIHYNKPPYNAEHDPIIVQRKIQQLRLHGMARLRKGLMEMQREHRELSRAFKKKSSGSDSSSPSPRESRRIQRPSKLRFPSSTSLRTDSKLDDFNIKRPLEDHSPEPVDLTKSIKRSSVNDEILATKLEDSMSTDSDSDEPASVNSSVFSSPNILPVNTIEQDAEMKEESSDESESGSESSQSSESGGEVNEESEGVEEQKGSDQHSPSSVEEAQFDIVDAGSDSDGSISF